MKKLLATALTIFAGSALAGEWRQNTVTDAMTDEVSRQAVVSSPEGHKLTLARRGDGSVWGYVELAGINQFGVNDTLMIRVDKHKAVEFSDRLEKLTQQLGMPIKSWEWNPSLIGFRMWHGKVEDGCGLVEQLYHGQQVVIRYHPNKSTYSDITFPLTGNAVAITDALGIDLASCPASKA